MYWSILGINKWIYNAWRMNHDFYLPLKVLDDAKIGEVYSFQGTTRLWKEGLDRSVYSQSIVSGYTSYPKSEYYSGNANYIRLNMMKMELKYQVHIMEDMHLVLVYL